MEKVDCSKREHDFDQIHKVKGYYGFDMKPLYYWQTLIKYEHCNEFFTYLPKYNDYVAMQSVRDDTTADKEFCVVEGTTWPPQFCSTFPPDFQKETLKMVIADCKNRLCELAQSGKWKAGWFKQGKAKKMPWPREMQKDGHQSLGYEDAFHQKCWHGPKAFGDMIPDIEEFLKQHDLTTTSGTFNKKSCGCRTEDDCSKKND